MPAWNGTANPDPLEADRTAIELYNDGRHVPLMFNDLVDDASRTSVRANQFLIVSDGEGALIDPAGAMTFNALIMAMQPYFPFRQLKYIFASHQDPDIVASLDWIENLQCGIDLLSQDDYRCPV